MRGVPRMSTTASGDNVILTYVYILKTTTYTLAKSGSSYIWEEKPQQLSISRIEHLQFTIPISMINC